MFGAWLFDCSLYGTNPWNCRYLAIYHLPPAVHVFFSCTHMSSPMSVKCRPQPLLISSVHSIPNHDSRPSSPEPHHITPPQQQPA